MSNGQNEASNYGQLEGIFQCSRWMERRNPSISRFSPARMYFLIASFVRDSIVDFLSTISSIEMESGEKHSEGRAESARMRVSGSVERLSSYVT